jgi:hypothetical protein
MFNATSYWITIVELETFQIDADDVFTEEQRSELFEFLAANPHYGNVIEGTGGVRKIRWSAGGKGKRGGARVIYYFRDLSMPVFMLAVYKKGEKMNLTMSEREQMRALVQILVREYGARRRIFTIADKGSA